MNCQFESLQLIERIGGGGFKDVYKCSAKVNGVDTQMAELRVKQHDFCEFELNVLLQFDHPNIIKVIGTRNEDGYVKIYTELMDMNGYQFLKQLPEGKISQRLHFLILVASGIRELHKYNIVHRDLKPENVLVNVNSDGTFKHVKITDFGLSAKVNYIQKLSVCGTRNYIDPELEYGEVTSPKVDQYSFGVMMDEILGNNYSESVDKLIKSCMGKIEQRPDWEHIIKLLKEEVKLVEVFGSDIENIGDSYIEATNDFVEKIFREVGVKANVLVVGPSQVGKSSMIKHLLLKDTGREFNLAIGGCGISCTQGITCFEGETVNFYDTRGAEHGAFNIESLEKELNDTLHAKLYSTFEDLLKTRGIAAKSMTKAYLFGLLSSGASIISYPEASISTKVAKQQLGFRGIFNSIKDRLLEKKASHSLSPHQYGDTCSFGEMIHVIWYVYTNVLEDAFLEMLAKTKKVIFLIRNQSDKLRKEDQEKYKETAIAKVKQIFKEDSHMVRGPIFVAAAPELSDSDQQTLNLLRNLPAPNSQILDLIASIEKKTIPTGVEEILNETVNLLPDSTATAFARNFNCSIVKRIQRAVRVIKVCVQKAGALDFGSKKYEEIESIMIQIVSEYFSLTETVKPHQEFSKKKWKIKKGLGVLAAIVSTFTFSAPQLKLIVSGVRYLIAFANVNIAVHDKQMDKIEIIFNQKKIEAVEKELIPRLKKIIKYCELEETLYNYVLENVEICV